MLWRKLVRDLLARWGQVLAAAAVMGCGIATFVMAVSTLDSLGRTLSDYYAASRFAEVFVSVKRAPLEVAERAGEIPGVAAVQARVVESALLDMPGIPEPASAAIVSLPRPGEVELNRVHLRSGRTPVGREGREVLVSEDFASAHGLAPGDRLRAVLNGRRETLRVVGVALSPEFIYTISPGGLLPDNLRYGVLWMGRDEMAAAFDMEGAFNSLLVRTSGGPTRPVIDRLDTLVGAYGGLGAYERADQASHEFVANELRELRGMTVMAPTIFLSVSAFLVNIVLARTVGAQREQIATLRALGVGRWAIGAHYGCYALAIAGIAGVVGVGLGVWMGRGMTALYADYYAFPRYEHRVGAWVVLAAVGVAVVAAVAGVAHAVAAGVRLRPAEAMRPQAPARFRVSLVERLGLGRWIRPPGRAVLRYLERRPLRTGLSCLGIAMATGIVVLGGSTADAVVGLVDMQFGRVQRYDVGVVLRDASDASVVADAAALRGVVRAEGYRAVSARLDGPGGSERIGVMGLDRPDGLYQLLDMHGRRVLLPREGLLVSATLAERLGLREGDPATLRVLEGRRRTRTLTVNGVIEDFTGSTVYMSREALRPVLGEGDAVSGLWLGVRPGSEDGVLGALREAPAVAGVQLRSATMDSFRGTVDRNLRIVRRFLLGFAVVIAFGVVYNSVQVSMSERSRDLATMRVVGFSRAEVARVQLGELWLLVGLGVPLGLVIGRAMAWLAARSGGSDLIRLPFVVERSTYAAAALVVVGSALACSGVAVRRVARMDYLGALKARE
jgi:putative ABC transport system permease protein